MPKRRRKKRLCDIAAMLLASAFLAVDLMVRDPAPASPTPQGDTALAVCTVLICLGLLLVCRALYGDRHEHLAALRVQIKRRLPSAIAPLPLPVPD